MVHRISILAAAVAALGLTACGDAEPTPSEGAVQVDGSLSSAVDEPLLTIPGSDYEPALVFGYSEAGGWRWYERVDASYPEGPYSLVGAQSSAEGLFEEIRGGRGALRFSAASGGNLYYQASFNGGLFGTPQPADTDFGTTLVPNIDFSTSVGGGYGGAACDLTLLCDAVAATCELVDNIGDGSAQVSGCDAQEVNRCYRDVYNVQVTPEVQGLLCYFVDYLQCINSVNAAIDSGSQNVTCDFAGDFGNRDGPPVNNGPNATINPRI